MKWTALIVILFITSCIKLEDDDPCSKYVRVSLINKGTSPARLMVSNGLDSIVIFANSNDTISQKLCFSESLKTDGSYRVRFSDSKKDLGYSFGYFTNGLPLEKRLNFTWANDTLHRKSVDRDY
jgi:hypothetical protein